MILIQSVQTPSDISNASVASTIKTKRSKPSSKVETAQVGYACSKSHIREFTNEFQLAKFYGY